MEEHRVILAMSHEDLRAILPGVLTGHIYKKDYQPWFVSALGRRFKAPYMRGFRPPSTER